ncbi:MAG: arginase family protein [Candidatus Nanoarchaeia archaeon]|nr:arginase family protein [Candidatus Nanoarchaeia archaeon]
MKEIISIPRINALGLKGPEKTPEILLKKINHTKINTENQNISRDEKEIFKRIKESLSKDKRIFILGGDHSITYPSAKAFLQKYKQKSFIIIFDAHADCMPPMKEPTHEEFLAGLVKFGWNPKNICLIGVRKIESEEKEFLEKNKIKYFKTKIKTEEILNYLKQKTKNKKVYFSIDIDVIDPKFAPAVNYPEKKGLTKRKFFKLFKKILSLENLRLIDLVEIVLPKDKKNKTKRISKKIIYLINHSF